MTNIGGKMSKKVLVDFDNTLVDFSHQFYKKIHEKYGFKLDPYDCLNYDYRHHWKSKNIDELAYLQFFDIWDSDEDFYLDIQLIRNYNFIINQIKLLKENGYKIILDSKSPTDNMTNSKRKYIETHFTNMFDEVIIDGNLKSYKSLDYDVIIEDNPSFIEHYLNNTNGKVILAKWKYNDYLIKKYKDRIIYEQN